jgi:5-oxopent-3-ene-1,2,5-tricarboxylate decarboxylase/2-hydroxyhepta-2,4-diene-1,7-dioate isomerase
MSVLDGPRTELRRVVLGGRTHVCTLDGDQLVLGDGRRVAERDAAYAAPVDPGTIICVHLNYRSRAIEFGSDLDNGHPTYFMKPATAINAHRGQLVRPRDVRVLNYEGEIAAIVGRPMRSVKPADVWDYLQGFACANDVGAHDFRDTDSGSMLRVKGQDGFCPIGPGIVSGIDIRKSTLRTFVNGELVQEDAVANMVWGIDELFADITRHITLRPGDVVLTGTPWHSRPMFPGDVVEVAVDGLGKLTNLVVEAPAPDNHRGFPATVTKTSLGVALGSDYQILKRESDPPTPEQYQRARSELRKKNMAEGPKKKEPR